MESIVHTPDVIEIVDFFKAEECHHYINFSESQSYEAATVETERGSIRVESVRNNDRVIFTDGGLATLLWEKVMLFAPGTIGYSAAIGLNEMFRFYRYQPGQQFKKHIDNSYIRNETEASYFTLLIYLNDDFKGGETTFGKLQIKPKKGNALIFLHSLEHEGAPILEGVKYVLRTDIMYQLKV